MANNIKFKPKLVRFSKEFLTLSWVWLNDEEIKKLTNTPTFSIEEQHAWYMRIDTMKDYLIWGIELESVKIGACGLKNITKTDCEYWGYIGEKKYWGRGIGYRILLLIEGKAEKLGLSSIWLKVLPENQRAISLYKKSGYCLEQEKNNLWLMRKRF